MMFLPALCTWQRTCFLPQPFGLPPPSVCWACSPWTDLPILELHLKLHRNELVDGTMQKCTGGAVAAWAVAMSRLHDFKHSRQPFLTHGRSSWAERLMLGRRQRLLCKDHGLNIWEWPNNGLRLVQENDMPAFFCHLCFGLIDDSQLPEDDINKWSHLVCDRCWLCLQSHT